MIEHEFTGGFKVVEGGFNPPEGFLISGASMSSNMSTLPEHSFALLTLLGVSEHDAAPGLYYVADVREVKGLDPDRSHDFDDLRQAAGNSDANISVIRLPLAAYSSLCITPDGKEELAVVGMIALGIQHDPDAGEFEKYVVRNTSLGTVLLSQWKKMCRKESAELCAGRGIEEISDEDLPPELVHGLVKSMHQMVNMIDVHELFNSLALNGEDEEMREKIQPISGVSVVGGKVTYCVPHPAITSEVMSLATRDRRLVPPTGVAFNVTHNDGDRDSSHDELHKRILEGDEEAHGLLMREVVLGDGIPHAVARVLDGALSCKLWEDRLSEEDGGTIAVGVCRFVDISRVDTSKMSEEDIEGVIDDITEGATPWADGSGDTQEAKRQLRDKLRAALLDRMGMDDMSDEQRDDLLAMLNDVFGDDA